jgi:bifunctional UDP-N-acetylglucosamine pyrophosphorylase/glucosamine-1-phosphate N-acetyltransferase
LPTVLAFLYLKGELMEAIAAVILVAGKGVRMKSRLPKVLHPLAGRPMIRYVVDAVRQAGVSRVILVTSPDADELRQEMGSETEWVVQSQPLGTGHALEQARSKLEGFSENVLVLYGDTPVIRGKTIESLLKHHLATEATATLLTCSEGNPAGLGRILRGAGGSVLRVVEEKVATAEERAITETNSGVQCFKADWLWAQLSNIPDMKGREVYLTDLIELAAESKHKIETVALQDPNEAIGVNTRVQLALAEAALRTRIRERLMLDGVTIIDPSSAFIDAGVEIEPDTVIFPNTTITGASRIETDCQIGPGTIIVDSEISRGCRITASVIEEARLDENVDVGPFSHVRPGSRLEEGVHVGNFAEIKKSRLGRNTKMGHFSYIGDADLGEDVNVGAGTVTCNFDGVEKHETKVGDGVFIGSDTMLVAPVEVGDGAKTGAGTVVNHDVPPNSLAIGMPARITRKKEEQS